MHPEPTTLPGGNGNSTKAMNYQHVPISELPACQMDSEALSTLSYVFTDGKPFARFIDLYTWFMAGLPELDRIGEFWDEVADLGY